MEVALNNEFQHLFGPFFVLVVTGDLQQAFGEIGGEDMDERLVETLFRMAVQAGSDMVFERSDQLLLCVFVPGSASCCQQSGSPRASCAFASIRR